MENTKIPESLRRRVPLLQDEWIELYNRMGTHPHAPRWNTECGDRLTSEDISFVKKFAEKLSLERKPFSSTPPGWLVNWILGKKDTTGWFREKIKSDDIEKSWLDIEPMQRKDMQGRIELIVPEDADLNRLVVNPTSGTTGHPIPAPNHPKSVGCYDPLIQYALERHGVIHSYDCRTTAAIQICSQKNTIVYHTVHSYLDGAGFAKINLEDKTWNTPDSAGIYIKEMKPVFLSGDPYSFMQYMRMKIEYRPQAVLTTALALSENLREEMESYFSCPVIDMYSLNETGPVAYSCPSDPSKHHILPHDLFAEIVDSEGRQVPEGTAGGIALSGGRNPYLPLLRYLTGDTASISYDRCICGEKTPSLKRLQGRAMVLFRTRSGRTVNSIDISGIIRKYPVYFFSFIQKKDFDCSLSLSAGNDLTLKKEETLKNELEILFNGEIRIYIDRKLKMSDGKNIPFISEII